MTFMDFKSRAISGQELSVPASWAQGRTVFGGISAGLLSEALQQNGDPERRLRYLEIGFNRVLEPDVPFRIDCDEETAGRTVAVRTGRIVQDDIVRVTAQANFIAPPNSAIRIDTFKAPELPRWDDERAVRLRGPGTPAFTQHIDFRAVTRGIPFSGRCEPEIAGWMRFERPPDELSAADLICLIDSWPPVASSYFDRPVPMSSINWQLHLAEPADGIPGHEFLGYRAHCNFFDAGYGSSSAEVWAPDGRLLAKSFQTFLVFG
jgi:acyl-CoA thioesterase